MHNKQWRQRYYFNHFLLNERLRHAKRIYNDEKTPMHLEQHHFLYKTATQSRFVPNGTNHICRKWLCFNTTLGKCIGVFAVSYSYVCWSFRFFLPKIYLKSRLRWIKEPTQWSIIIRYLIIILLKIRFITSKCLNLCS